MLVLLHGSGDDDSKPENWMPHVAAMMQFHGDLALVLPGVGSEAHAEAKDKGIDFCRRLKVRWERAGRPATKALACTPSGTLHDALSAGVNLEALRGFRGSLDFDTAAELIASLDQKEESSWAMSGNGIKFRATVAGICAILYEGYLPDDENKVPLRIVGHSRGGCAAITAHNLCTYWGLTPRTLVLDPCHGVVSLRENKLHWHNVWGGNVVNIPVMKNVGDARFDVTKRLPVTAHPDGNATVTNHDKLPDIKHGHMGKLKNFSDAEKTAGRADLQGRIHPFLVNVARQAQKKAETPRNHLQSFYETFATSTPDRDFIWERLKDTIAFARA